MAYIFANNMDCAISSASESVLDHTLGALRTHRTYDNFAPNFLFDSQGFFQGVAIRLAYFKRQIGFFNPG